MSVYMPMEIELCRLLITNACCVRLEIGATMGMQMGVLVAHRGKAKGMWVETNEVLAYQSLSNVQMTRQAQTVSAAVAACIEMAECGKW